MLKGKGDVRDEGVSEERYGRHAFDQESNDVGK